MMMVHRGRVLLLTEGDMTLKSLILGGLLAAGLSLGAGLGVEPAEAKTRVHIGIGIGDPYYGYGYGYRQRCVNPGYIDWCGAGFARPGYYQPGYYQPGFYDPYFPRYAPRYRTRDRTASRCDAAAQAIRNAGYRNIRATDCSGRYYGFRATKRGRVVALRVDNRTGRISVRR
jgi:hypothetical protein